MTNPDPQSDDMNRPSFAYAAGFVRAHHDPRVQRVAMLLATKGGEAPTLTDLSWPVPVTADLRAAARFLRDRAKASEMRPALERAANWLERSADDAERLPDGA